MEKGKRKLDEGKLAVVSSSCVTLKAGQDQSLMLGMTRQQGLPEGRPYECAALVGLFGQRAQMGSDRFGVGGIHVVDVHRWPQCFPVGPCSLLKDPLALLFG